MRPGAARAAVGDARQGRPTIELGSSDDLVLLVSAGAALLLLIAAVAERTRHRRRLARIPIRISVNGSRGKSTVTRLLTGALAAGGRRPIGKTTGTAAQLVLGWDGTVEDVHRRPEGPNIGEQRHLVRRAVAEHADTLVAECMAVTPEYQLTFHRELLDINVLVITNAWADHLEEMGPTVDDVAEVLADSIPAGGLVVVPADRRTEVFRSVANDREAAVVVSDVDEITPEQLEGFEHLVLPEHLAQVLAVTRYLGIDDARALRGMREAPADPYATRLREIGDPDDPALLVNAFPANDPTAALAVWEHVVALGAPAEGLLVVMNCREDRIARTQLFARDVLPHLPIETLVVTGSATRAVHKQVHAGAITADTVIDLTDADASTVMDHLDDRLHGRVVLGVGNLHGGGAELVAELEARDVTLLRDRKAS